jgi:hypothetical protein
MRPYSEDLPWRVVRAVGKGTPREEVAEQFEVSVPTIERWVQDVQEVVTSALRLRCRDLSRRGTESQTECASCLAPLEGLVVSTRAVDRPTRRACTPHADSGRGGGCGRAGPDRSAERELQGLRPAVLGGAAPGRPDRDPLDRHHHGPSEPRRECTSRPSPRGSPGEIEAGDPRPAPIQADSGCGLCMAGSGIIRRVM